VAQAAREGKRDNRLMLAAAIILVVVAAAVGGWYTARGRQKSATQSPSQSPVQTVAQVVAPASAATTNVPAEVARASEPTIKAPAKKTPTKTAPAGANVAATKPDATTEAKADASPAPKAPEAAPVAAPGAVGFDPTKLDRKQNAKLDIDATRMPAGVSFTVLMNGKVYLQKTGAQSNLGDEDFFVPPGVQEFLVIAKSGVVEKASNTVSTEFLAKKRNSLKIEARSKGMPPGSGVPQGLYPDTEIVVTLK